MNSGLIHRHTASLAITLLLLSACATVPPGASASSSLSQDQLIAEVTAAETAFAQTMVDRDHAAFLSFVAEDAVFLNGGKPLRGKAAIGEFWKRFYTAETPPFSWKPDHVVVVSAGNLAQTVGPVAVPSGKVVSRFNSTWRREPDGQWRVVFDEGADVCDCPSK